MAKKKLAKGVKKVRKSGVMRMSIVSDINSHFHDTCPTIIDMRRPHSTESSCEIAKELTDFHLKSGEYEASVRSHYFGGGLKKDVPQFDPKNFPNPNSRMITENVYNDLVDDWNNGKTVVFGPRYNPILVELCHEMKAIHLRRGFIKKHPNAPKNWDESKFGSWNLLDEDGERSIPSGWFFDKILPRRVHAKNVSSLISDIEANVVTIGQTRYVVGDGTNIRSAPMLVWATKRGTYRFGDHARKQLSLFGNKDVSDIVFRVEDRATNGGGVVLKANWGEIKEVVVLPGQALTAGFLFNANGDRLTSKEIRLSVENETTGIRFKTIRQTLGSPIISKSIPLFDIWVKIQELMSAKEMTKVRQRGSRSGNEVKTTPQNRVLYNLQVTCRVSPAEAYPFGFWAAQCDMVPFVQYDAETDEFSMGIVIGDRSNYEYNVGVQQANAAIEVDDEDEDEEDEFFETETPKKTKKSKVKKPKTELVEEVEEVEEVS